MPISLPVLLLVTSLSSAPACAAQPDGSQSAATAAAPAAALPVRSQSAAPGAATATATAAALAPIATRVRTAALFKNGLAFVQRHGTAPAGSALARLDALPVPTHGTFWIAPGRNAPAIASAVARKTERVERVPATSIQELLFGNVGRKLTLVLSEKESLVGTLTSVPEPRKPDDEDEDPARYGYLPEPVRGLLYLDTGSGVTALDPRQVLRLSSSDGAPNRDFERRVPGRSLTIAFASAPAAPAEFELSYLGRGLTWAPSYAIDISEPGKALLVAKAEVIDESEDLEGATLSLVTGFPNLQFAHVADPIALRGNLEAFLNALGNGPTAQQAQVLRQSVQSNSFGGSGESANLPVTPEAAGGGAEDLFLYEQRDVTLAKGERGFYPLFQKRVACEHVYEWKIADTVSAERYGREREGDTPPQEEIWHSLRLTNDTGLPWTTAPAMTQKGGTVLGQDTLRYTAIGAQATVRRQE